MKKIYWQLLDLAWR